MRVISIRLHAHTLTEGIANKADKPTKHDQRPQPVWHGRLLSAGISNHSISGPSAPSANRPGPCIKNMHALHNRALDGFRSRLRARIIGQDSEFRECRTCPNPYSHRISRRPASPSTNWRWRRSRAPSSPSCGLRSARTPAWRPSTTGTRRRRWRCATASCTAG